MNLTLSVPGFAPYAMQSVHAVEETNDPFIIEVENERNGDGLSYLPIGVGETLSVPLDVLNNYEKELSAKGLNLVSLHEGNDFVEASITDGVLNLKGISAGRGLLELQIGDYKQSLYITSGAEDVHARPGA